MITKTVALTQNGKQIELYFCGSEGSVAGKRTALALGTFDGVHIAHKELLNEVKLLGEQISADLVGAWCFEECPASVLRGERQTSLSSKEEKISLLLESGLDFIAMGHFSDFKDLSAENFVTEVLKKALGCIGTVTGYDHRFGCGGKGTPQTLEELFGKDNAITVPKITLDGETVGSSAIRSYLSSGNIEKACLMLGRPFSIQSTVTEGKKLGRKLGFPTANQQFPTGSVQLKRGVYATLCSFGDGKRYMGVTNVGIRPSISEMDDHLLNCETYIINFSDNVYGKIMKLEFFAFLREETKFPSLDELTEAIKKDSKTAAEFLSNKIK